MSAKRFEGRAAIVTGAGSGIGRATSLRLASEGASVVVADLKAEAAQTVVGEIEAAGGVARAHEVDVSEPEGVEAMVAAAVETFGRLDLLHNNAAAIDLNFEDQDVVTGDLGTWERVLAVNLMGPLLGCRYAIPRMLENDDEPGISEARGAIVNTASAAAFYGSKGMAAYGTSKAALVGLTRNVATAYAHRGIRCNAVAPGVVIDREAQEALGGPTGETLGRYTRAHLTGRLGYPEEIAGAVAYLLSDEAAFVTGEVFRIDGGLTVGGPIRD